jgi:hypothetical protein
MPESRVRMSYRETFQSPYENCGNVQCSEINGQRFTVLEEITKPTPDIDAESLPMFDIVLESGIRIMAWPEECLQNEK